MRKQSTTSAALGDRSSTRGKRPPQIKPFVEFVRKVQEGEFVPVPERIAVFDNEGKLWSEKVGTIPGDIRI